MRHKARLGFTLLEALASAAILGVGIAACMKALGAIELGESRAREVSKLQRMARDKYDELISTNQQTIASSSGDFTDRNIQGYTWNLDVENSQVSNLDTVTVTVQKQNGSKSDPVGTVEGMVYVNPNQANTSSGANTGTP